MKLTKVNIAKVAVPRGKSEVIEFDDDVPGFGLRVRAGGSATWIFQYRQGAKQRRLSLGSASAITAQNARERASELHARVRLGEDPAGQKIESRTKAAETFGTAARKDRNHVTSGQQRSHPTLSRYHQQHGSGLCPTPNGVGRYDHADPRCRRQAIG